MRLVHNGHYRPSEQGEKEQEQEQLQAGEIIVWQVSHIQPPDYKTMFHNSG